MPSFALFTGLFALSLAAVGEAAAKTTKTTTRTIFLPSRSTGSATNIYASIITESSSTTEFLLACQTGFSSPYNCDGEFKGVTVTYGPSMMDVAFGATEYDCDYGTTAVCETRTTSAGPESTITFEAEELSSRMTAITILDDGKKKKSKAKSTKAAQSTAQSDSGLCKRKTTHNSDDSTDSDSGGSSGSSNSGSSSSSDSSNSKTKKKGSGCSEGSLVSPTGSGLLFLSIAAILRAVFQ